MLERLKLRVEQFKAEYKSGQGLLIDLEGQVNTLRESLMRITGAIQVLEEEIARLENAE